MTKLVKGNKTLHIKVNEKNIKHTYIKQKNGYIEISKSRRMNMEPIIKKIEDDFDFYYTKTLKKEETILSLWGRNYSLKWVESSQRKYIIENKEIIIYAKVCDYNQFKDDILKSELQNYLIILHTEVEPLLKEHGLYLVPVKVKKLKSKYGSYHKGKDEITLNSFLASIDKVYTKHVLLHEYAHQKVANHQLEFYQLLDKLYPTHKETQRNFKKIGLNY
ncbi:MAG: DUF45 domain-containing protein [Acholeplasmataceae bacterium]|nr:DUF45 domain-containing protein [Acholeplasmataceae bacterium]